MLPVVPAASVTSTYHDRAQRSAMLPETPASMLAVIDGEIAKLRARLV